jgi:hypothetical protein
MAHRTAMPLGNEVKLLDCARTGDREDAKTWQAPGSLPVRDPLCGCKHLSPSEVRGWVQRSTHAQQSGTDIQSCRRVGKRADNFLGTAAKQIEAASCLQAATWRRIEPIIQRLQDDGRSEITVLVMGKPGTGVSSTVNAILGERVYDVRPSFGIRPPPDAKLAELSLRKHDDFMLRIVHTRWLINAVRMWQAAKTALRDHHDHNGCS